MIDYITSALNYSARQRLERQRWGKYGAASGTTSDSDQSFEGLFHTSQGEIALSILLVVFVVFVRLRTLRNFARRGVRDKFEHSGVIAFGVVPIIKPASLATPFSRWKHSLPIAATPYAGKRKNLRTGH